MYPKLVEWIDTYWKPPPMPALTEREVKLMLDHCVNARQRALIQVLFNGFRLGELLSVRLRHVQFKLVDAQRCFFIHVPFSKTHPRTIALPMPATKNWLNMWLEKHPGRPLIRADGTLETANISEQLFPMTATAARIIFRNIGRITGASTGQKPGPPEKIMRRQRDSSAANNPWPDDQAREDVETDGG